MLTSVVGGVGAMAVLGLVFQNRDVSAGQPTAPIVAAAPINPASTMGEEVAPIEVYEEPAAPPAPEPEPPPPAPEKPTIQVPVIPTLGNLVANEVPVAPTAIGAPKVVLPSSPTRGAAESSNLPLRVPQLRNQGAVQQALEREYPVGLREVGIGGTVELSFYVNEQGLVERYQLKTGSGNQALDQAALRVAPVFQFTPAQRGTQRVAGWFSRVITFGAAGSNGTLRSTVEASQPDAAAAADPDQPVATRFDIAPQVRNQVRVQQALAREYPRNLRDSGIGGKAEIWFYVNDQGAVERYLLKMTSGNRALDQAAMRVAKEFEFNPGTRGNTRVPGWLSLWISFDGK